MTYEEAKMQIQAIPEKIWDQLSEPDREAMEMAFSALQAQDLQQTCNQLATDTISRQAAIDLCDWYDNPSMHDDLEKLPSAQPVGASMHDSSTDYAHGFADGYKKGLKDAQPEPQWIPVSERLPDDLGDYLVSIKRIGWNMEEYVENDIAYWDDLEGFHKADEVLAWMPLPEPYREVKWR